MNLLPKCINEFGKEKYWDEFFSKVKKKPFEWYGEYDSLCEILDKYIRLKDRVLVVGCGNSKLSAELYNVGFCNVVNIDISATVIKQMKDQYKDTYPKMIFEKMDMFEMTFENGEFSVVLDKGTLDAIAVDVLEETSSKVHQMFSEISRVLKYGGRYICVSLLQEHILWNILNWFTNEGWMVRIHRCLKAEQIQPSHSLCFPVFVVICTKMKKNPGLPSILELDIQNIKTPKRVDSIKDVVDHILSVQHFGLIKSYLSKKKLTEDLSLELCSPKTGIVKYHLFVVDRENIGSLKFAVFIVPQGRETEWLFGAPEGRRDLATNADCERLVVVHLIRGINYESIDEVKKDLSASVMELAPPTLKSQVPFLSVGDDIGSRELKEKAQSENSGDYVVEDVSYNGELYRRLVFLNNPRLIQSEAKLINVPTRKKKRKNASVNIKIDFSYIACDHHAAMILGLTLLRTNMTSPKILVIGLGGGSLAMYLYHHFPKAKIEAIELDPEIVMIAKKWFELVTDDRLVVHIDDGIKFIEKMACKGEIFDAIMIDADSKDTLCGMSCPPPIFVETPSLKLMSQLMSENSVLIMNLACRNASLRQEVYDRLKDTFPVTFHKKIPAEVNEVVYCLNKSVSDDVLTNAEHKSKELLTYIQQQSSSSETFDVKEILNSLKRIS